jgi:hypothetical protein
MKRKLRWAALFFVIFALFRGDKFGGNVPA